MTCFLFTYIVLLLLFLLLLLLLLLILPLSFIYYHYYYCYYYYCYVMIIIIYLDNPIISHIPSAMMLCFTHLGTVRNPAQPGRDQPTAHRCVHCEGRAA